MLTLNFSFSKISKISFADLPSSLSLRAYSAMTPPPVHDWRESTTKISSLNSSLAISATSYVPEKPEVRQITTASSPLFTTF